VCLKMRKFIETDDKPVDLCSDKSVCFSKSGPDNHPTLVTFQREPMIMGYHGISQLSYASI
jgi:hypothetical protein